MIHMGDLYFASGYPFVDFTSGGSIDGTIAAVASVLAGIDDHTRVIPGHGPLSDRAGLRRYHDMLVTVRDRIGARKRAGASLADVMPPSPRRSSMRSGARPSSSRISSWSWSTGPWARADSRRPAGAAAPQHESAGPLF